MEREKKIHMKRTIIIRVSWMLLFIATIALFVYAAKVKDTAVCKEIKVEVTGKKQYVFVNEEKIKSIIAANGGRRGYIKDSINLQEIEDILYKDVWVKKAEVYFDNNNILQVLIDQSDPVARIFTTKGETFYIDSSEAILPVNASVTTRLPVFTSFPQNGLDDSLLITDIKNLSMFLNRDTFWSSMFSQINIINKKEFEIVPVLGNHLVYIGEASRLNDKFNKLYSFYKQVWIEKGLDKYKKINVSYEGQVVATLRDSASRKDAIFGRPINVYDSIQAIDTLSAKVVAKGISGQRFEAEVNNSEKKISDKSKVLSNKSGAEKINVQKKTVPGIKRPGATNLNNKNNN